jgi:hypothetical protein
MDEEIEVPAPAVAVSLTEEQLQRLIRGAPRPKVKEPETFDGKPDKLRIFLVQLRLYFQSVNWQEGHDNEKILYAASLLREGAAKWITPYVELRIPVPWEGSWDRFVDALNENFQDVGRKERARHTLHEMRQGSRTVAELWNDFRMIATDADCDESTLATMFIRTLHKSIQDAWATNSDVLVNTETLARWAIAQENKMEVIRTIQQQTRGSRSTENQRNDNGTFRPTPPSAPKGDAMDLDATNKRRFSRLPTAEYQRRRRLNLCLKCGKPGHMIKDCRMKEFIREAVVETGTLNEESPQ